MPIRGQRNWDLLVRPYPFEDETLFSYYYRIAKLNCIPFKKLVAYFMLNEYYLFNEKAVRILFKDHLNIHLNQDQVRQLSGHKIRDLIPSEYFKNMNSPRFCPLCLAEENYIRMKWHFKWNLICLKHQAYLLDHCPFCFAKLNNLKLLDGKCKCGRYIFEMKTSIPEEDAIFAQKILENKLNYSSELIINKNPAFNLPSKSFFTITEILSCYVIYTLILKSDIDSGIRARYYLETDVLSRIWTTVIKSLNKWPEGFHDFVDNIVKVHLKYNNNSQNMNFVNRLRQHMSKIQSTNEFFLLEIEYLKNKYDENVISRLFGVPSIVLRKDFILIKGLKEV